ncbi:hypothetical protein EG829_32005, partial [bacterium]|nr:hypothetical protein [bacterium]
VLQRLEKDGARLVVTAADRPDLNEVLDVLYQAGMRSLLVEGGGTLLAEFFRQDLVDEVSAYLAPRIFGGASAPTLADGAGFTEADAPNLVLKNVERFDDRGGVLIHYAVIHKE